MEVSILDGLFDGVLYINREFKIVYANDAAKRLLGREGLEGSNCKGIFSICQHCPMEYVKEEREGVQVYDVELSNSKHACWSMSPVFAKGNFLGVLEVFRDVSNVVHCIVESERQRTYKEAILNSIVEAILVLNHDGEVLEHNQVAKRMLCADERDSLVGRNIKELINLSLDELPPEGERCDIYIKTPCGRQKASLLVSPMKSGFGLVVSLYVVSNNINVSVPEEELIITKSPVFQKVLDLIKSVAEYDVNVLLEGETGTGKSLLAKYIHYVSPRRDGPFVRINCTAIPESLLEAELFGYVKGAFTGALKDKPGKVELADKGTVFLDEIGDMPLSLQAKILHLVHEKEFERIGDTKTRKANVRIIAATNKNLKELVSNGLFREDLYYRLNVVHIHLPSLRERKEDVPLLAEYFLTKYANKYSKKIKGISPEAMRFLLSYDFPGNVRELENIIERSVITCTKSYLELDMDVYKSSEKQQEEEKVKIKRVLEQARGNRTLAAKLLGIHRTTLWRKIKELGL